MSSKTDLVLSAGCAVAICTFTGLRLDWWIYLFIWLLLPILFNVRLRLARWGPNARERALRGSLAGGPELRARPLQIG